MAQITEPIVTLPGVRRAPSGILGLDEITGGGLPAGRTTLVCGSAGCGKTLLAIQFLVQGASRYGEPGVLMTFEETARDLTENVASLGYELERLTEQKQLRIDHVRIERAEIEETGEYDLDGLFVRLAHAIESIGARRVVLDTLEALFGGLRDVGILRAELRRLFGWLKERGVTSIVTAERGGATLTRHGFEEYVSDCVILLDHRVNEQMATRRLRVVKYRGARHGTNEYPFLIDDHGIDVLPVTSLGLDHVVSNDRLSTGIPGVDDMLGGRGLYRGSSVLVSGSAGTGKTTMAAHFVNAACRRGERCAYFAMEESRDQILRNMRSVGIDLGPHVASGLLHFHCTRPTLLGLEAHLASMVLLVREFDPVHVVVDPITSFGDSGTELDVKIMSMRLIDLLKTRTITAVLTSLTQSPATTSEVAISSLIDTWLLLHELETNGERRRGIYVLKSRGMEHSHRVREFVIGDRGIQLRNGAADGRPAARTRAVAQPGLSRGNGRNGRARTARNPASGGRK